MLTVKEVSRRINLSEHTIRFYADKGLIPSMQRDKNNIRLFSEEAINTLIGVRNLRETGMPLEAIREYIDLCGQDGTIETRRQIILAQRDIAREQLEEAKKRLEFLEKKAALYDQIAKQELPDMMNPNTWPTENAV